MIKREDLVKIGQFGKPHGIKGELSFTFTSDVFDESECNFLVCEIDGIFVPFVLEEYRFKSNSTAFIKLKRVDSDQQAKSFVNLDVYFPKEYMADEISEDEPVSWDYFIGYQIVDNQLGEIGKIQDVDDTTINILFIVEGKDQEYLIPAVEEMIEKIDPENHYLYMNIPEGLINL